MRLWCPDQLVWSHMHYHLNLSEIPPESQVNKRDQVGCVWSRRRWICVAALGGCKLPSYKSTVFGSPVVNKPTKPRHLFCHPVSTQHHLQSKVCPPVPLTMLHALLLSLLTFFVSHLQHLCHGREKEELRLEVLKNLLNALLLIFSLEGSVHQIQPWISMLGSWNEGTIQDGTSNQLQCVVLNVSTRLTIQWKQRKCPGSFLAKNNHPLPTWVAVQSNMCVCKCWLCKLCHLAFVDLWIHQLIRCGSLNSCKPVEQPTCMP